MLRTISIWSVPYAGRGAIELDLRFSCGTPTMSDYSWEPRCYVEIDQGRREETGRGGGI